MLSKEEEKRERIVDEIIEIRENSVVLKAELHQRGVEGLDKAVKDQTEDMIRDKIWHYLEV